MKVSLKETSALADLSIEKLEGEALALIDRASIEVRMGLAQELAFSKSADHAVVLRLSKDQIEVAELLLEHSPILQAEDQLRLIESGSESRWRLLSKKTDLTNRVILALIATKSTIVMKTLANNHGCELSYAARGAMLQKSKYHRDLQISLLLRPDLTKQEATTMRSWVSEELAQYIAESLDELDENEAFSINADGAPSLSLVSQCQRMEDKDAANTVNDLARSGTLQPSILMKALHAKNGELFLAAFAKLLEISAGSMKHFFAGYRAPRLAIACHAAGINQAAFQTMYLLIRHLDGKASDVHSAELLEAGKIYGLSSAQARQEIREICA